MLLNFRDSGQTAAGRVLARGRPQSLQCEAVYLIMVLNISAIYFMKKKHQRTLTLIFSRPVSGSIKWADIEALFIELGGEVQEREGSRIAVVLFGQVKVFHRPHPSPDTDKGAVASVRKWLEEHGVKP
ncbi:type II toxin-antitoxin system HicA family toxin [Neisseria sp.]|uniref:type II toxin-antitoxin system HicA family toxin n=1 Tax=Neisseria sp. TaxID=192066 RepID=UPI00289DBBEE|nr:type II toxin-antitoxin system HicA family toxin [Neisseria sp.]